MTLRLVIGCDGHRHGDRCRGRHVTHADPVRDPSATRGAFLEALGAGWRSFSRGHLCHSRGHDEDDR